MTLTTIGDDHKIEQITKHLNRLIDVVKLVDLTEGAHIERELMLIKVRASGAQRAEIKRCVDIFRGQIIDVTASVYTIQLTGTSEKLDAFMRRWVRPLFWKWCVQVFLVLRAVKKYWGFK